MSSVRIGASVADRRPLAGLTGEAGRDAGGRSIFIDTLGAAVSPGPGASAATPAPAGEAGRLGGRSQRRAEHLTDATGIASPALLASSFVIATASDTGGASAAAGSDSAAAPAAGSPGDEPGMAAPAVDGAAPRRPAGAAAAITADPAADEGVRQSQDPAFASVASAPPSPSFRVPPSALLPPHDMGSASARVYVSTQRLPFPALVAQPAFAEAPADPTMPASLQAQIAMANSAGLAPAADGRPAGDGAPANAMAGPPAIDLPSALHVNSPLAVDLPSALRVNATAARQPGSPDAAAVAALAGPAAAIAHNGSSFAAAPAAFPNVAPLLAGFEAAAAGGAAAAAREARAGARSSAITESRGDGQWPDTGQGVPEAIASAASPSRWEDGAASAPDVTVATALPKAVAPIGEVLASATTSPLSTPVSVAAVGSPAGGRDTGARDSSKDAAAVADGAGIAPSGGATPTSGAAGALASTASAPTPAHEQIAGGVLQLVSGHAREVVLRLHPAELGDVTVRVAVSGRDVTAWFAAPQPQAQDTIAAALGQLQAALGNAGYNLIDAWVGGDGAGAWLRRPAGPRAAAVERGNAGNPAAPAGGDVPRESGMSIYV
ncbi:MAG: flagellar hook-length control protein FliK [Alphaproteobacteria bacterium]|nr:flagellar hook-length control protein FliK [Alphaproteobacteria bacterium]